MKRVPKSLKYWFVIHFILDYLFAIPLLISPNWFLSFFDWQIIDLFSARLVGAALIGIGGISLIERDASVDVYKSLLNLKIIWSSAALFGIFITMLKQPYIFGWIFFGIFAIFCFVWIYYRLFL